MTIPILVGGELRARDAQKVFRGKIPNKSDCKKAGPRHSFVIQRVGSGAEGKQATTDEKKGDCRLGASQYKSIRSETC